MENLEQQHPEEKEMTIDLLELAYALLDKIWWIIGASVLGAVAALLLTTFMMTPQYQATSKIYVLNSGDTSINLSQIQLGTALTKDYMQVFDNWHVHDAVANRTNVRDKYSNAALRSKLTVENPRDTRIISISFTSPDPKEAQAISMAYAIAAQEFIAVKMDMEKPTLFEEAQLPTRPCSPNKARNTITGFMLGLVLSSMIIVLLTLMDDRVRNSEKLQKSLGLSTIGMMPIQEHDRRSSQHRKERAGK